MADNQSPTTSTARGKTLAAWDFPEFVQYRRGLGWFAIAIIVVLALVIFSISTQNYIFLILIFLISAIMILRARRTPEQLSIVISEDGIELGVNTFYSWNDINSFWIIYQPPDVKNLYFDFKTGLRPAISISMENQNPMTIRNILLQYLTEDTEKENESFSDGFSRMFKI